MNFLETDFSKAFAKVDVRVAMGCLLRMNVCPELLP